MKRMLWIVLLFAVPVLADEISKEKIGKLFLSYVEALQGGDYAEALNHWSLLDRESAGRLNIQYQNTPLKLDAESKLVEYVGDLISGKAKLEIDSIIINRGFAKIEYHLLLPDLLVPGTQYANVSLTTEPLLTSPIQVYADNWDHTSGRYFDLILRDFGLFEPSTMETADSFIVRTARFLGTSEEKLKALENTKFRSYLAESYGEVGQLSGSSSIGVFYQPADAVVSKYFPPYHEMAQFLVVYVNGQLPYYTLPFIKYGTAAFLGGKAGRSAGVLLSLGRYLYNNHFMELDSIVTSGDFIRYETNPDFSYSVAGLFCKYLYDKLGRERYFALYRSFSGSREQIDKVTVESFHSIIGKELGMEWSTALSSFEESIEATIPSGITAGAEDTPKLVYESGLPHTFVQVREDDHWYHFVVTSSADDPAFALLLGAPSMSSPYESFLFKEQFHQESYGHQQYGVIFSSNEVGCYDYFTNEITGKYIVGLSDDQSLAGKKPGEYRFKVRRDLLRDFDRQVISILPVK